MNSPPNEYKASIVSPFSPCLGQVTSFMGQGINALDTRAQQTLDRMYHDRTAQQFNTEMQNRAMMYGQANQQNLAAQQAGLAQNQMAWRGDMAALHSRQMQGQIIVDSTQGQQRAFKQKQTPIKHASWFRQFCWRRKMAFGEMLIRWGEG